MQKNWWHLDVFPEKKNGEPDDGELKPDLAYISLGAVASLTSMNGILI